jgi:CBS domain-containing protein
MLVVDSEGKLAGLITRGDVLRALQQDSTKTVLDASSRDVVVTYPDETLNDAAAKMLRYNVGRLPVVDRSDDRKIVGYLGRPQILSARLRRIDEESVREPGWFKGFRRTET